MIRWIGAASFLLLLLLAPVQMTAQQGTDGPQTMAQYMPPVDLFATLRTDQAYIDQLDRVLFQITDALPDDVTGPITLTDVLNDALLPDLPLDATAILTTLIGDYAAIGIDLLDALDDGVISEDDAVIVYAVAPIQERDLLENALRLSGITAEAVESVEGAYTRFTFPDIPRVVALSDRLIYIVEGTTDFDPAFTPSLADMPGYTATLDTLTMADYSAIFYGGTGEFVRELATDPAVQEILAALGFDTSTLGPVASGLSITDDGTLLVDVMQARNGRMDVLNPPVAPDFARYIPAESEVFVHTTDINQLLTTVSGLIASISGSTTERDIYAQFENLVAVLLGLDLQTDILPWASGDYGVFARLSAMQTVTDPLRIGAVVEVTDLAAAQTLIDAVRDAIVRLFDDVPISESRIVVAATGASVDALIVELQDETFGQVEVAIGAYDNVLFVATYDMAVDLLDGGRSLLDEVAYTDATDRYLPGSGLGVFVADRAPGAVIRLAFELLDPLRLLLGREATDIIVANAPGFFTELVRSSSVSAATTETGDLVLRFVISLEPTDG